MPPPQGGIVVLPSANRYRAKAAECEQKAQEATDPEVKRNYAKLARQWRELAEQVEPETE